MSYKYCSEISPVQALNPQCPFNCVDCEYFGGLDVTNKNDIEIICELEDN